MRSIKRILKRIFTGPFEILTFGLTILALSIPSIIMIFIRRDVLAETPYFSFVRGSAIVWGLGTFIVGAVLVFLGARSYAAPGTIIYHITHPRLFPR
jgi:hypothetical protein